MSQLGARKTAQYGPRYVWIVKGQALLKSRKFTVRRDLC